ncbi:MAG: hypothetical protein LBJ00_17745 [Planctomycetaceae bacterium]|nr:hypothetical protein [Planctomycetaceae bacterium]
MGQNRHIIGTIDKVSPVYFVGLIHFVGLRSTVKRLLCPIRHCPKIKLPLVPQRYTVAGRAIGFALEQPLHVVALACSASEILK